jgi:hypothetical protein
MYPISVHISFESINKTLVYSGGRTADTAHTNADYSWMLVTVYLDFVSSWAMRFVFPLMGS